MNIVIGSLILAYILNVVYKVYIREREYHLEMKQINYERQTKEEYYDSLTDKLHQMRRQSSMGGIVNGFYHYGQRILTLLKCEMNFTTKTYIQCYVIKRGDTNGIRYK